MIGQLSLSARLSLFYLLHYAGMGVHLPGMQLWYQAQGVSPAELGALGFVTILARDYGSTSMDAIPVDRVDDALEALLAADA